MSSNQGTIRRLRSPLEILFGGRLPQLEETFKIINRGPLSDEVVKRIQALWEKLQPRVKYIDNLGAMQWDDVSSMLFSAI